MNVFQRQIFSTRKGSVFNTYIGGIAVTVNTSSLLAAKLGITVGRIYNFTIVGSNVMCYISGGYVIPVSAFENDTNINSYIDTDSLVTNIGYKGFAQTTLLKIVEFKGIINLTGEEVFRLSAIETVFLENCVYLAGRSFASFNAVKIIYTPRCTTLGPNVGSVLGEEKVFYSTYTGTKIYLADYLRTVNSGSPDNDIPFAVSQGATIVYVTNYTAPSSVTSLTATNVYNTSVSLGWSVPGSTNAIEFYEVYVNGVLYKKTTNTYITVLGLTNSVNYNFTIKVVDVFYNKSGFSNTVNQTINGSVNYRENIVSYWKFNNNALDSVNSNNGVETSITYSTGKIGNAGVFNGSSSYVTVSDSNSLTFENGTIDLPFSISYWVYFNTLSGTSRYWILGKRSSSTVFEYQCSVYDGTFSFDIYDSTNNAYIRCNFSYTELAAGSWIQLTHTYGGTGVSSMKSYKNGTLISTTSATIGTYSKMRNTTSNLILGKRESGNYLSGMEDELIIYNKELTSTEVSDIYTTQNAGTEII